MTEKQIRAMMVYKAISELRYSPLLVREYYGFASAQGGAVALKGERGIVIDSSEGLLLTNIDDATRYMLGEITFAAMRPQREFVFVGGDKEARIWVESDRFVPPCSCEPALSEVADMVHVCGEDDCPVHGFGDGEETDEV